jgi:hypothetical protein
VRAELDRTSTDIVAIYQRIATENALPLQDRLTAPEQQELLEAVRTHSAAMAEQTDIESRVRAIMSMQIALRGLVASATASDQADDPRVAELNRRTGSKGDMQPLLEEYSLAAKEWNDRMATRLGAWTASLHSLPSTPLPLLRFDGKEEYETIIKL